MSIMVFMGTHFPTTQFGGLTCRMFCPFIYIIVYDEKSYCINSNPLHCSMCNLKTCVLKHGLVLYRDKKYLSNCVMYLVQPTPTYCLRQG